jgi:hypothetical protein
MGWGVGESREQHSEKAAQHSTAQHSTAPGGQVLLHPLDTPAPLLTLLMSSTTGMRMKVTTVRRQEAANMKDSTMPACVALRRNTLRLRHTWSLTVWVSTLRRLVRSPGQGWGEGVRGKEEQSGGSEAKTRVGGGDAAGACHS